MIRMLSFNRLLLPLLVFTLSLSSVGLAWKGDAHEEGTRWAISVFHDLYPSQHRTLFNPSAVESVTPFDRFGPVIYDREAGTPPEGLAQRLAWEAKAVDHYMDLEFVHVQGAERDDPHRTNSTVAVDCHDYGGNVRVDSTLIGQGVQSQTFEVSEPIVGTGRYTLRYSVSRGGDPYQLLLTLNELRVDQRQELMADEIILFVNGRLEWEETVRTDRTYAIHRTVPFYDRAFIELYEKDFGLCPRVVSNDRAYHIELERITIPAYGPWSLGNTSAMNHFIDIEKGRGTYDDYDGYSYRYGSGGLGSRGDLDDLVMFLWNDRYIHHASHYTTSYDPNRCSPAVSRYGRYSNNRDLQRRFPEARSVGVVGSAGMGVPYSVFLPIDNMARYWWEVFQSPSAGRLPNLASLGPVLHAIQDVSVPHHVNPRLGNDHGFNPLHNMTFEEGLDTAIRSWLRDTRFRYNVERLVAEWDRVDPNPPTGTYHARSFYQGRAPAINWPIDQLVTWLAVHTWGAMNPPGRFDATIARPLTERALALTILVLKQAAETLAPSSALEAPQVRMVPRAIQMELAPVPGWTVRTDQIERIRFDPASPAALRFNERVTFTFDYVTTVPGGVYIWGRPMTRGQPSADYAAHGSELHPPGEGSASGHFTITAGAKTVDQVRIQMVDSEGNVVMERVIEVLFAYR